MTYKKLLTKKLFYGRWPYKIETITPHASAIRYLVKLGIHPKDHAHFHSDPNIDLYMALWETLVYIDNISNIKIRIEGPHANFFTDSMELVEEICNRLQGAVEAVYAPASENELTAFSENKKLVIVKCLPHKTFTHRITIKRFTPVSTRETLKRWLENLPEGSIKTTFKFDTFLSSCGSYSHPYFYIKDEKTVSMISLMIGSYIHSIEKFVLSSSINTLS